MVYDGFSCIKEITKIVPIALSTACQGNEIIGISNVLDGWKRQYIPQLQGVVVGYKDIILMSKYAYIKSDYPMIHCNVKATFVLFIPVTGSFVKGKIVRISYNYIGCLVHNTINVAVHRSIDEVDDSDFIALDQEILFEITDLNFKRKIVRVKGKITQECVKLMKELQLFNRATDTASLAEFASGSSDENSAEENDDHSQSLLSDKVSLFSNNENYLSNALPKEKKKKSHKVQTKSSSNKSLDSLDLENEDESQSLLSSTSKQSNLQNSDNFNSLSRKRNKIAENVQPLDESFTSFRFEGDSNNNETVKEDVTTDSSYKSPKKKKIKLSSNSSVNENSASLKKKKANKTTEKELPLNESSEFFNCKNDSINAFNNSSFKEEITTDSSFNSPKKKKKKSSNTNSINSSVNQNSNLPKKKKKKANKITEKELPLDESFKLYSFKEDSIDAFNNNAIKEDITTDSSLSSPKKKKKKSSTTNSLNSSVNQNSTQTKKEKKKANKVTKKELHIDEFLNAIDKSSLKDNSAEDSSNSSRKKKKSKSSTDYSVESLTLDSALLKNMFNKEECSTDTSSHSTSSKKKKHKKSKENLLNSPPLFNDSLSSSKEDISPFKIPKTPKKKHGTSKKNVSTFETTTNSKDFAFSHQFKDITTPGSFHTPASPTKSSVKEENYSENEDNLMNLLSKFDPLFKSQSSCNDIKEEPLDPKKKSEKRKLESPDKESSVKKKKKLEMKSQSVKTGNKSKTDKLKKKNKGKSKKDSKKDKGKSKMDSKKDKRKSKKDSKKDKRKSKKDSKKAKIGVISTKKKLPPLKKEKGSKKKKKSKMSSKEKKLSGS